MKTHLFFCRKKNSPLFCLMVGISLIILLSGLGYSQEIIKKTPEQLNNSLVLENQFLNNKIKIDKKNTEKIIAKPVDFSEGKK